jgi:uncharacterized protein
MKIELDRTVALPASADTAWTLLSDVEAVAGCLPGAKIVERLDAQRYKGTVAVKLGPASLLFRGDVEVRELDAGSRTLRLVGKGSDTAGGSAATMDLTAQLRPIDAASCELHGRSEVSLSGKVAAFGARLAQPAAEQVLTAFAGNLTQRVQALQAAVTEQAAAPTAAADLAAGSATAAAPAAAAPAAPPPEAPPLNALALLWAIVKQWLRSLFARS